MHEDKTVSQAELDVTEATLKQAQANADAIRAIIAKKTIRAPFAGRLGIRLVNLGEQITAGQGIVSLQSLSPMFVDFTPGHWLTLFRGRVPGAPKSQMLLMTKDKEAGKALPANVPAYETMPPGFMVKLIASWAAMGFRRPKIIW